MTIPRYILILVILDLIFAFAGKLNHGNILAAELDRILHGLQCCHDRHLWNTTIEMVADGLAKLAHISDHMVESQELGEIPMAVLKLFFIDKIGLPYFRHKCT